MSRVTKAQIDDLMANSQISVSKLGDKTCVMVAILPSGFEIVTSAACVEPEDYSEEIGESICRKKLENKLWELEGYAAQLAKSRDEEPKRLHELNLEEGKIFKSLSGNVIRVIKGTLCYDAGDCDDAYPFDAYPFDTYEITDHVWIEVTE